MEKRYNIKQSINLIITCLCTCLIVPGCSEYLEEKDMPRLTSDYYQTAAGVESAATAAYSYMRWGAGGENFNVLTEFGTDLFTQGEDPGVFGPAFNMYGSQLNPDNSVLNSMWSNHYKAISTTNLVLQEINSSTSMTEDKKKAAIGEMSFLRAYFYFDLVQQFGSIPLVLDASYEVRTDFKRASIANVYSQIIKDLTYASKNLPEKPSSTGRATCYAASHLLSKVYLTRGSAITDQRGQQSSDMDSALFYAQKVINSGKYSLQNNFSDLWNVNNQGNSEVIFSVQFTPNLVYDGNGNTFHLYWGSWYEDQPGMFRDLTNGRPYRRHRATNKTMSQLFDRKNDSRFYKSFKWTFYANKSATGIVIGDTAIYYSMKPETTTHKYKYYAWNTSDLHQNNRYFPPLLKYFDPNRSAVNDAKGSREWVRMRLGETYLLAAEAAGRKGDYETARDYINIIRQRAAWKDGETKMPQYWKEEGGLQGDTQSTYPEIKVTVDDINKNFIDFILDERGRELLGETCRWEDLVRCEKLENYVKQYNPDAVSFKSFHKLRPIPQSHIDRLNPRGTDAEEQNEGYY